MESVKRARARYKLYPQLLAKCSESASFYAKCVAQNNSPKKNDCIKEFENFMVCLANAAKNLKTRL